jgi:hypothetical protein
MTVLFLEALRAENGNIKKIEKISTFQEIARRIV